MDTHDKQLLMNIATMVEDNNRRLRLIEDLIRSGKAAAAKDAADKESKRAEKQAQIDALSAADRELFDALRDWRRKVAARNGHGPMTVCQDRALLDIVAVRPMNEMALRAVNPNLATKYGPEILSIVKRHGAAPTDSEPW